MFEDIFLFYVIMQGICNKFIKMKISVACMVWPWLRLLQHQLSNIDEIRFILLFSHGNSRLKKYNYRKYLNPLCYWCAVVSVRIKFVCIHYETKLLFDCGCYENPLQLSSHNQMITLFWNSQLFLTSNKILLLLVFV